MSLLVHALFLFFAQTTPAFDRAEALLNRSDGVQSAVTVTVEGMGTYSGNYSCRKPGLQRFRIKGQGFDEEFAQSNSATTCFDHIEKEYTWYPGISAAEGPPDDASLVLRMAIPITFANGTLTRIAPKVKWKPLGTESVNGTHCDVLTYADQGKSTDKDPARIWIDMAGRIHKFRLVYRRATGTVVCEVIMGNPVYVALPVFSFDITLPWGYVPSKFPSATETVFTGEKLKLGELHRWPGSEKTVIDEKGPLIVLFTSDDLQDQSDVAPWKALAAMAKKERVRFVQVWLGNRPTTRAADWDMFWDSTGGVEHSIGPPVTPYLLGIRDSTAMSGWQGWPDGVNTAEALLKPLRSGG